MRKRLMRLALAGLGLAVAGNAYVSREVGKELDFQLEGTPYAQERKVLDSMISVKRDFYEGVHSSENVIGESCEFSESSLHTLGVMDCVVVAAFPASGGVGMCHYGVRPGSSKEDLNRIAQSVVSDLESKLPGEESLSGSEYVLVGGYVSFAESLQDELGSRGATMRGSFLEDCRPESYSCNGKGVVANSEKVIVKKANQYFIVANNNSYVPEN